jgi:membrane-associated phospholipid phosphatase
MRPSPSLFDLRRRLAPLAAAMAAVCAAYEASNIWHWRTPFLLPLTALDHAVPFCPWAMPLYVSHFIFLPVGLLSLRGEAAFARTLKAVVIAAALSDLIFLIAPTTFARPEAAGFLFDAVRRLDTGANCFPSQHVALAAVVAAGVRADGRPWAPLACVWAAAICVSTVLVKQHYALDIAGGLLLAAFSWRLAGAAAGAALPEGEPA